MYEPLTEKRLAYLRATRPKPANQITLADVRARIKDVTFKLVEVEGLPRTTVCLVTMNNGYEVVGTSTVHDVDNFDECLGQHYAYSSCIDQMFPLVALLTREEALKGLTTLDGLVDNTVKWGKEKGIFDKSNALAQLEKTEGELRELRAAIEAGDRAATIDEAGDVIVTLIMGLTFANSTLKEALETAYTKISKRKGVMRGGVFVKKEDLDWEATSPYTVQGDDETGWVWSSPTLAPTGPFANESLAWESAREYHRANFY